jgi:hypothetical protein
MRFSSKKLVATLIVLFFLMGYGGAWGQELEKKPSPTDFPEDREEKLPERRGTPVGYVPGIPVPDSYGTLGLGPTAGVLAPYGNPAAFDSLKRGWRSRRVGKVIFTPFLAADGLYRSNIFLTPVNKKSDFIMTLTPGLRAELPIAERHRLSFGYLGTGFIYTEYPSETHYDQNINADLVLNLKGRNKLRLGNTFRLATEERNSLFAVRRRYWRTTPYLIFSRALADRWKLQLAYQFDTLQFLDETDQILERGLINNYNQQNLGATLFYKFWPKTAVLLEYIYTYREYPNFQLDNHSAHSPLVGLTWDPTAKLTGTIKFGYTFRDYENSLSQRNNNPENWILSAALRYRYSRYTKLSLTAQRSFQDDVDFGNFAYRTTGVWVSIDQTWRYFQVDSYATFFFINNDYLNSFFDLAGNFERRHDTLVGAGVGLSRPITRRLRARIDYNYINRSSNFFGFSYNDHRFFFGLATAF